MSFVDFLRAVLIGQTCWTVAWIALIYLMIWRQRLRPGFMLGITILALGDFCAVVYVLVSTLARFGQPADYKTWLALIAIVAESFGCAVMAAHLFFHDEILAAKIKALFKLD